MDLYRRIFEHTPDALFLVDPNGRISRCNAQVQPLFGYHPDELLGREIEMLIPARFVERHVGLRTHFFANARIRQMGESQNEMFARRKDGSEFPIDIMLSPLDNGEELFVLCAVRDMTERRAALEELRQRTAELERLDEQLKDLASHDSLTGLLNRRSYLEQTEWILKNSARRAECVSLLMIDLDFFKRVNDRFGHGEGDQVLLAVAHKLQSTCRQNDVSARYGGEEFAVTLPDTDEAGSRVVAENFRSAIEAIEGLKLPITASVGIVTCTPVQATSPAPTPALLTELINQADQALYAAKKNGRNQVCHFNAIAERA